MFISAQLLLGEAITKILCCSGSNVDNCGIFSTFVSCIIAYTGVVPFFLEQGVWKPIFISNHWLVSHFQVDICCGKGAYSFPYLTSEVNKLCILSWMRPNTELYMSGSIIFDSIESIIS